MVNRIAEMLRQAGAVTFGDFVLASGARSTYYIDVKNAITDPFVLKAIGEVIGQSMTCDVVAGVAVGGIPLAVATSLSLGIPYAIVRSEVKSHGKSSPIIGNVRGKKVVLVEDVTTSGGSALKAVNALRQEGAYVDTVVAIVDREEGAVELLKNAGCHLLSLTSVHELVSV